MTFSSLTKENCFHNESSQLVGVTPWILTDWSDINFSDMSNTLSSLEDSSLHYRRSVKFLSILLFPQKDACNVENIHIRHWKNVCCCLVLLFLKGNRPTSFAWAHSPCAKMIWILTTFLILFRPENPSYRFNNVRVLCEYNWCPRSNFHQFIKFPLKKTNSCQHSTLSNLMRKRPQQNPPVWDAANSMSSEINGFHIWFSRSFWCSRW